MREEFLNKKYMGLTIDAVLDIRNSHKVKQVKNKKMLTVQKVSMDDVADISTFIALNIIDTDMNYLLDMGWFVRDELRKQSLFQIEKDDPSAEEWERWVNAMQGQFVCVWGTGETFEKLLHLYDSSLEVMYVDVKNEDDTDEVKVKDIGERFYLNWLGRKRKQKRDEENLKNILIDSEA